MVDFKDAPQDGGLNWQNNCFKLALQTLNDSFKDPTIIEIGTLRVGQGSSSDIFAWYVSKYGGKFRTCDINEKSIDTFMFEYVGDKGRSGDILGINKDGIEYLRNFAPNPIHFLYLDSMDSEKGAQCFYSSLFNVFLFVEAQKSLCHNSLILIDDIIPGDIQIPINNESPNLGKGIFLIPYLLSQKKAFRCLKEGYQYLFQVI